MSRLDQLRASVALLAAPSEQQVNHLAALFRAEISDLHNVDEIALEFDDVASLRASMLADGEISDRTFHCIEDLNRSLIEMSGSHFADLWTVQALKTSDRWASIRQKASLCLQLLDSQVR